MLDAPVFPSLPFDSLTKYKHVSRALETLEYIWLQRRFFGEASHEDFLKLTGSNLLP